MYRDIDIFQEGGPAEKDLLDRTVEGYEENVPLLGQIAAGFTPPGMAMDIAAAGKYGRDAFRDFREGNLGEGALNLGIATLSGLAAVPLIGEIANLGKQGLKQGLKKGVGSLDALDESDKLLNNAVTKQGADEVVDISKIQKTTDPSGNILRSAPARVEDATNIMKNAGKGYEYKGVKQNPRQPIEVLQKSDGSLEQLSGKSTLEALENAGISQVPVKKFNNRQEFEAYEQVRKFTKEQKRVQDAIELQPKIGSPTLELKVEPFGSKTEGQVKKIFNSHQDDVYTGNVSMDAEFIMNRGVRLNPEFQQSIDDIAGQFGKKTAPNPGGAPGKIDELTGQPKGQVKGVKRMIEKANDKYGGDISQMTDPIRTRIIVNNPAEERELAKAIADKFPAIDSGRVLKPEGYIDRKLNIQFTGANGEKIVAEVGLITDEMWQAADKGHVLYEEFRSILPKGIPTDPKELAKITDVNLEKARALQKEMKRIYSEAGAKIDPDFFDLDILKFASGGEVTYSVGKLGKMPPMVPNFSLNSASDSSMPSKTKSTTCLGLADTQASSLRKKASTPSGTGSTTAGPFSHEKYNRSSINHSLQNFTNNYNPNDINIFDED